MKSDTEGQDVMEAEAKAIRLAGGRLGAEFEAALDVLEKTEGKVIVTGLGKSGHVGRKMAATFCSTGTRAVFLHATEAAHGADVDHTRRITGLAQGHLDAVADHGFEGHT